jgi:hypothetical protein
LEEDNREGRSNKLDIDGAVKLPADRVQEAVALK